MPANELFDPAHTQVVPLQLNNNEELDIQLCEKAASAAAMGYQLAGCFPHHETDRLVLVFQKPLPRA